MPRPFHGYKTDFEVGLPLIFESGSVSDPKHKREITYPWIPFEKKYLKEFKSKKKQSAHEKKYKAKLKKKKLLTRS